LGTSVAVILRPLFSEGRTFSRKKRARNARRDREGVSTNEMSCPDLIRASIDLREDVFRSSWIAGSSVQSGNDEVSYAVAV
jgi:hypothetical protein